MKWKYSANASNKFFPHFIPSYRYPVRKNNKIYEDYCKYTLMPDKPGCFPENVGKNGNFSKVWQRNGIPGGNFELMKAFVTIGTGTD